jgi:D-alanine-D-alanine ligase
MSKKIRVALIFGGRSAEHEISLISAAAIHKNLNAARFDVRSIYITRDGLWKSVRAPAADPRRLASGRTHAFLPWRERNLPSGLTADIYFPVLHGPYGEDGTIQGLLEMAGVPYVGAGVLASALAMDKAVSKAVLHSQGLPVVPHMVVPEKDWRGDPDEVLRGVRRSFGLPLFVKPANLGSSVGVAKVKGRGDLAAALEAAFRYDTKVLVEKAIVGREIECSVLGNESPEASLPGEVIPYREFYDYQDKYSEDSQTGFVIPIRLPARAVERIRRLAVAAFKALDGAGMARVDFFLESKTGRLFVNEVNTIPGFTEISMFPRLWQASGLSFPKLVERLIDLGFERFKSRKACIERDS